MIDKRRKMNSRICARVFFVLIGIFGLVLAANVFPEPLPADRAQVPTWSQDDLNFFLHGSMGTEIFPEPVLRALIKTYPDLFPTSDLSHLGLIADQDFGWPIGFSRKIAVKHLGDLPAVGINCASCHVSQITSKFDDAPIRILGTTSHFNVEAFFGSVLIATFKTTDPANMKRFLAIYLGAKPASFDAAWSQQEEKLVATMKDDPLGAKDIASVNYANRNCRPPTALDAETDLASRAHAICGFFTIFAPSYVPDQPPERRPAKVRAGTMLWIALCRARIRAALRANQVRTGLECRSSQLGALGRQYPFACRAQPARFARPGSAAARTIRRPQFCRSEEADRSRRRFVRRAIGNRPGNCRREAAQFDARCASCHTAENDQRLHSVAEVGTDPLRANLFGKTGRWL